MADISQELLQETQSIVAAYVSKNSVPVGDLTNLIKVVHGTLVGLRGGPQSGDPRVTGQKPAVPIKKSILPDHIVCLEDGKKLTMLKRYLRTRYNQTPDDYRTKWGLPADYPMVAPNYSAKRSAFAKKSGLGLKRTTTKKRR